MPGTRKLGRASDHRTAMLRAMVTYLLENGKIETTVTRAKEVRSMAEKYITQLSKRILSKPFIFRHSILKTGFSVLHFPKSSFRCWIPSGHTAELMTSAEFPCRKKWSFHFQQRVLQNEKNSQKDPEPGAQLAGIQCQSP